MAAGDGNAEEGVMEAALEGGSSTDNTPYNLLQGTIIKGVFLFDGEKPEDHRIFKEACQKTARDASSQKSTALAKLGQPTQNAILVLSSICHAASAGDGFLLNHDRSVTFDEGNAHVKNFKSSKYKKEDVLGVRRRYDEALRFIREDYDRFKKAPLGATVFMIDFMIDIKKDDPHLNTLRDNLSAWGYLDATNIFRHGDFPNFYVFLVSTYCRAFGCDDAMALAAKAPNGVKIDVLVFAFLRNLFENLTAEEAPLYGQRDARWGLQGPAQLGQLGAHAHVQTVQYPLPANHAEHPLYLFQEQPPQLPHGGMPQHMYQPHHHHQQQQIMQPQPYWPPPTQPFGEAHNQGPPSHYLSHPQVQGEVAPTMMAPPSAFAPAVSGGFAAGSILDGMLPGNSTNPIMAPSGHMSFGGASGTAAGNTSPHLECRSPLGDAYSLDYTSSGEWSSSGSETTGLEGGSSPSTAPFVGAPPSTVQRDNPPDITGDTPVLKYMLCTELEPFRNLLGFYKLVSRSDHGLEFVRLPDTFHFDADEEGVCFSLVGRDGDELPGFTGPPWAAWVQMGRVGMAEDAVKHFKDAVDKQRKLLRLHFDATGKRLLKVVGEHGNDCLPDEAHRRLLEANLEEVSKDGLTPGWMLRIYLSAAKAKPGKKRGPDDPVCVVNGLTSGDLTTMVMTHYRWSGDFDEHCATTPLKEALPITLQLPYNLLSCLFEDEQLRENVYECFLKPPSGAGATRVFYLQDLLSFFNAFGEERNLRMAAQECIDMLKAFKGLLGGVRPHAYVTLPAAREHAAPSRDRTDVVSNVAFYSVSTTVPNTFSLHIYFVNEHGHVEHRSVRMEGKKGGNGSYTFAANALDIEKLKEDWPNVEFENPKQLLLFLRTGHQAATTAPTKMIRKHMPNVTGRGYVKRAGKSRAKTDG